MSQYLINKSIYSTSTKSKEVMYSKKGSKFTFNERAYNFDKNDTIFRNQAVAYLKPKYKVKKEKTILTKPILYNTIRHSRYYYSSVTCLTKPMGYTITKRYMRSVAAMKAATSLVKPTNTSTLQKSYSTKKVRQPDYKSRDPEVHKNNPKVMTKTGKEVKHTEVTSEICEKSDCKENTCKILCSTKKDEVSIGHMTKTHVRNAEGETHNIGQTNINGNANPQQLFLYKKPHKTNSTQKEIPAGTKYVNNPDTANIIKQLENKNEK